MWGRLKNTKTLKLGIAGIMAAAGAALGGQMSWPEAGQAIFVGLMALMVRDGVAKGAEKS